MQIVPPEVQPYLRLCLGR